MRLTRGRGREINVDAFSNPEKYLVRLPVEKIIADTKVSREGVDKYKQKIKCGEKVAPIIEVMKNTVRFFISSTSSKFNFIVQGSLISVLII